MIHFEIPKNQSSIIKVIGVGGGGGNAVNYMHSLNIEGVDFIVCNTDQQALSRSEVPNKIQLGPHLTQGLGAGANPEIGKQASEESLEDITKLLKVNTRMAFVTAGMGGGTGTGGAPVLAKICRDLGILTVGIVTTPFSYEGRKRMKQAQEGIDRMREHVDTILVINNDKMRQQFGNLSFTKAFEKADDILATAAKCITDVINTTGQINVDFADVCTVMKNGGGAILGNARRAGDNRAQLAAEEALNSPLLNDSDIRGAKWILLNITSAPGEFEHTLDEAEAIQAYVQQQAGDNCDVILGMGHDPNLNEEIAVTVIATGFPSKDVTNQMPERQEDPNKVVVQLQDKTPEQAHVDIKLQQPAKSAPQEDFSTRMFNAEDTSEKYAMKLEEKNEETPVRFSFTENVAAATSQDRIIDKIQQNIQAEAQATGAELKMGERVLSAEEVNERNEFEEQKRALEERAERLRKLSFDILKGESNDDIENVPAYMRRQMSTKDDGGSQAESMSGYSIGFNKEEDNQAGIQTINTFLDGNKPD